MNDPRRPRSLEELCAALVAEVAQVVGDADVRVCQVTEDSRLVGPGALFVARQGASADGRAFIPSAVEKGAVAVLCEPGAGVSFLPRIEAKDVPLVWGEIAQALSGDPSSELSLVGITGTNGKTTTATLVQDALMALGQRTARLGTLGFFLDREEVEKTLTTPQPDGLARALRRAADEGVDTFVMEVSSHALDQKRVAGARFAVAAFSNLSQDHLDYHGTLEDYGRAKSRLFLDYLPEQSVINIDDAFGRELSELVPSALRVSTKDATADVFAAEMTMSQTGLSALVRARGETLPLTSRLVGAYNLENLLVATGILLALGHALGPSLNALSQAGQVPGRMERVGTDDDDLLVLVDYAHTPDALLRALEAVSELNAAEVVCVFGCGGDRDRSKRPLMAKVASEHANVVWLTSDNPRSEDPGKILAEIAPGIVEGVCVTFQDVDRRSAIHRAILAASPGSVVLIAGKGHETYQLVSGEVLDFDDRLEASRALAVRRAQGQTRASD